MSLSQQFVGYSIVPWYDSSEWKQVYELIFEKDSTPEMKREALDTIYLWKTRMNLLPSGIEGTLCILEALLVNSDTMSDRQYCTLCASSIMRFLNVCVAHRAQVHNFTRTAKSNFIPDWIINIRHDFAHSHKLPGMAILKLALDESFRWLKDTYWTPELSRINDYVIEDANIDIKQLLGLYIQLFLDYTNNIEISESLTDELLDYHINTNDFKDPEQLITTIIEVVDDNCKTMDADWWKRITRNLVGCGFFSKHCEKAGKTVLRYKYVESLIHWLHRNNALPELVIAFANTVNADHESVAKKTSVASWMNDIFIGLSKKSSGDAGDKIKSPIKFEQVSPQLREDVLNLKHVIFQNTDEITKICFQSFMSISECSTNGDTKNFFSLMEKATTEPEFTSLNESIDLDQSELSKSLDIKIPEGYSACNLTDCDEQQPRAKKRRWVMIKNVAESTKYPLGALPSIYLE